MTSFLLFTLSGCHADIFSSFFHSLRLLHPEFSSLEAYEWIYAPSWSDLLNKTLLQRCDPHDFLERVRATRFLVDSWPATIHAHLVFLWELVLSLAAVSRSFLARFSCLHFAGHSRFLWSFQFLSCVLDCLLKLSIFRIHKKRCLSVFERCQALVIPEPMTCQSKSQATDNQVWWLLECL